MFPAGQHPIYPYTEEDERIVLENAAVKKDQLDNDVEAIRDWVHKQPHLAEAGIDPHAAAFHLITSKGSVERAKQRIDSYYRVRAQSTQEIEDRLKLLKEQHRRVWNTQEYKYEIQKWLMSLTRDQTERLVKYSEFRRKEVYPPSAVPKLYNGSRVQYIKVLDWENYTTEDLNTNIAMLIDIRYSNDFTSGDTFVIDLENGSLGHISKLNYVVLAKAYKIMQESLGLRIFAIHIVNCSAASTIQAVLNLCRVFLSKKLMDRIRFHHTPEGLFEFLPKEYVLEDYGGELPSYEVFRDKMEKLITDEKTKQFLIDACKCVSDESKRPKSEYDEDNLPGNFKKLDLD